MGQQAGWEWSGNEAIVELSTSNCNSLIDQALPTEKEGGLHTALSMSVYDKSLDPPLFVE